MIKKISLFALSLCFVACVCACNNYASENGGNGDIP